MQLNSNLGDNTLQIENLHVNQRPVSCKKFEKISKLY